MAGTSIQRAMRTAAAGAFVLALSLSSLAGSAVASPATDKDGDKGCSPLAHARNEAMHDLRHAWSDARQAVRELGHDAREAREDAKKAERSAFTKLMTELRDANKKLDSIRKEAREQMQDVFADVVCTAKAESKDNDENEKDEAKVSVSAADVTALTTKLDAIVAAAKKDMQTVVDTLKQSVTTLLEQAKAEAKTAKAKDDDEDEDENEDHDKHHEDKATENEVERDHDGSKVESSKTHSGSDRKGRDSR